jgi:hypothetical protein
MEAQSHRAEPHLVTFESTVPAAGISGTPLAASGSQLLRLRGVGPEFASVLSLEAFYRDFRNRRE